jgi:hypothetical protein
MISFLTIKMDTLPDAQIKVSKEIANAHILGWQVMSRQEFYQDGKYCIVVWITPQRKES